jgi:hypothetical protein
VRGAPLGFVAALVSLTLTPLCADADLEISVTSDQRVTIVGEHPSLEALIEDLSWRGSFELRSFGIEDRAVVTSMEAVPLDDALRRLVGRDLYTVGVSVGAEGTSRVTWVEIPGPREAMGARRGAMKPRASDETPFQVPPRLFLSAFESTDPAERAQAFATIERRVLEDRAERGRFLATDEERFVEAVKKYPEAAEILRQLAARQGDAEIRAKLDRVVAAIDATRASPPTEAPGL